LRLRNQSDLREREKIVKLLLLLIMTTAVWSSSVVDSGLKHVLDVCFSKQNYYFLTNQGKVYVSEEGSYRSVDVPDGIIQIQGNSNSLFLLRKDGSVWEKNAKGLKLVDGGLPSIQILAQGHRLYLLKSSGGLSVYSKGMLRNLLYDRNFEVIAPVGETQIFAIDSWGRLFRYDTYSEFVEMVDPSPNSVELVSGVSTVYVKKKNATVSKFEDWQFHPVDFPVEVKTMAADGDYLFLVDSQDKLYEFNNATHKLKEVNVEQGCKSIRIAGGRLFILGVQGHMYELGLTQMRKTIQNQFHRFWLKSGFFPSNKGYSRSQY